MIHLPADLLAFARRASGDPHSCPWDAAAVTPVLQAAVLDHVRDAACTLATGDGDVVAALILAQESVCLAGLSGNRLDPSLCAAIAEIEELATLAPIDEDAADRLAAWAADHPVADAHRLPIIAVPVSLRPLMALSGHPSPAVAVGDDSGSTGGIIRHDFTHPPVDDATRARKPMTSKPIVHVGWAQQFGDHFRTPGVQAAAFTGRLEAQDLVELTVRERLITVRIPDGPDLAMRVARSVGPAAKHPSGKDVQLLTLSFVHEPAPGQKEQRVQRVSLVESFFTNRQRKGAVRESFNSRQLLAQAQLQQHIDSHAGFAFKPANKGNFFMDLINDHAEMNDGQWRDEALDLLLYGHYCVETDDYVFIFDPFDVKTN